MTHLHSRFSDEQVKLLIRSYEEGQMSRAQVEETLQVGKTLFFALLKLYGRDVRSFSVTYHRSSPSRLSDKAERLIRATLLEEQALIEDPDLPISTYSHSAARERLRDQGLKVSLSTII